MKYKIREPLTDRLRTPFAVGTMVIIFGLVIAQLVLRGRHPGFASAGAAECRRAYNVARTAADTATIDYRHPAAGQQKDPNAPSCGTLRRIGEL